MKTQLFIIMIFFSTLSYSEVWTTDWSNNGNGWIGGWHIADADVYTTGNFIHGNYNNNVQHDLFIINKENKWAACCSYGINGWTSDWSNNGSGFIGGFNITFEDHAYVYFPYYNGFSNFLMAFVYGENLHHLYSMTWNNGDFIVNYENNTNHINGWLIRPTDKVIIGNFENSVNNDEMLLINNPSGWAYLCSFSVTAFSDLWSNGGSGTLPGWILRATDRYFSADVDGDNADELVCVSPYNGWAAIYKYTNGNWNAIWANGGNGLLGGWLITNTSRWGGFDFDNDINEELFNVDWNNGWSTIKNYDGATYWPDSWTNFGNHWINGWFIQNTDYYLFGNFNTTTKTSPKYLLSFNPPTGWSTMMHLVSNTDVILNNKETFAESYYLSQNYPNPFNPYTIIIFQLPKEDLVKIEIYDQLGKLVRELINEIKPAGCYEIKVDGINLASGNYFYRMTTAEFTETKLLTIIK
jgi:hypothetical protein